MSRTTLNSIIAHTKRLVAQTAASSPWTDDEIQDGLDQNRTHITWALLDHDPDYRTYYARAHRGDHLTDQIISFGRQRAETPDFAHYTQVGFFESDVILRQGREESSSAHTPDLSNIFDGTFTFSTPPNVELYLQGVAFNVYRAAADLLMETPGEGRRPIKSVSRGRISHTYDLAGKIKQYQMRGFNLNRRITRIHRA